MSSIFSLGKLPIFIGLIFILFSSEAEAAKDVPFLFAEDEALSDSGEFFDKIEKSHEIEKDEFLQSPLTKLDYILMKLENELIGQKDRIAGEINTYFEKQGKYSEANLEFHAYYRENFGRIGLKVEITGLGKPKQPMKKFCDEIIEELQSVFPQEPSGFMMYHRSLGILARKEFKFYKSPVDIITRNHSFGVRLQSDYKNGRFEDHYYLQCFKLDSKSPTQYETMSIGTPKK
jgi:hypothetical protein